MKRDKMEKNNEEIADSGKGAGDERELIIDYITPPDFGERFLVCLQTSSCLRLETADEVSEASSPAV